MSWCTNCGHHLGPGCNYCSNCGEKVSGRSIRSTISVTTFEKISNDIYDCAACNGKGIPIGFGPGHVCSACDGKGKVRITGYGSVADCGSCNGKGLKPGFGADHLCPICDGKGKVRI